jgi:hypothetical protein
MMRVTGRRDRRHLMGPPIPFSNTNQPIEYDMTPLFKRAISTGMCLLKVLRQGSELTLPIWKRRSW